MIRVLTIDDEPLALKLLEAFIGREPDLELVAACRDAVSAREHIGKADAVFVDINIPGMSGMEFVRSLEHPPVIVFTTALPEYAIEGYKVNAADYLLKPFSYDEFHEAVGRIRERLELKHSQDSGRPERSFLLFKTDYRTVQVDSSDILYIEGLGAYVKIHLLSMEEPLIVLYGMKRLAEDLSSMEFVRIHRSYIINCTHISKAGKTSVTLADGTALPVGEVYKESYLSKIKITKL